MSEIFFKDLNIKLNHENKVILGVHETDLIVFIREEGNDNDKLMNHILIYDNTDGRLLNKYHFMTTEQIIDIQKAEDYFLFLVNRDYEDGVLNTEPNVYMWSPLKGFYHSFYAGRYINSMVLDSNKNLWVGYDEMGIFCMVDEEISTNGCNQFEFKNGGFEWSSTSPSTTPYLIDQYYSTFVTDESIYMYYRSLGEEYLQRVSLSGETMEQNKMEFQFNTFSKRGSSLYFFIRDHSSYKINKVLKTNDRNRYEELNMLHVDTREDLHFTQVVAYKDKIVGLDQNNTVYLAL